MQFLTKSRQDNDVTSYTGVISIEYDIKRSRPIEYCAVYDEDETRK